MRFRRAVQRYGRTPEAVTPYQRAAQVWDDRIGSARAQAHNWRLMALGGLLLSGSLAGGLLWQSMQSRVVPYIVEVDRLGEPRAVSEAERNYQPTDPQIAWHLARFIADVRSVSLDPVLMRQNWLSAYDFVTNRGAHFLNDYARQTGPFANVGERTSSVQVTSVVRASDRSFQLKWVETSFDRGSLIGTAHWTAILTILSKPPTSSDILRKNPLGIYVDAIDWAREVEPTSSGSVAPALPPQRQSPGSVPSGSPVDPAIESPPVPERIGQ
jgi:type IV secretion system protein VirB5